MDKVMKNIDYGVCLQALLGSEAECGDIAVIKEYDDQCFMALIDVLGHGAAARKVAVKAKCYLDENYDKSLCEVMLGLHEYLKGTRGAVAAMCRLDVLTGELTYIGMGNITFRILGIKQTRLTLKDGIVGYRMTKPQENKIILHPKDIVIMYSDGIREHFDTIDCINLLQEDAEDIAWGILERFGKKSDDASCVVLKYIT